MQSAKWPARLTSCLAVLTAAAAYAQAGAEHPPVSPDTAVANADWQTACDVWVDQLSGTGAEASIAGYRLLEIADFCDLSGAVEKLEGQALAVQGSAMHRERVYRLAGLVLRKYRRGESWRRFEPLEIPAQSREWIGTDSPNTTALTALPVTRPAPGRPVSRQSAGPGGVLVTWHCFEVLPQETPRGRTSPRERVLSVDAGLPAAWYLDGQPMFAAGPGSARTDPAPARRLVSLDEGCHCVAVASAGSGPANPVRVEVLPADGLRVADQYKIPMLGTPSTPSVSACPERSRRDGSRGTGTAVIGSAKCKMQNAKCRMKDPMLGPPSTPSVSACPERSRRDGSRGTGTAGMLDCGWYALAEGNALPFDAAGLLEDARTSAPHLLLALAAARAGALGAGSGNTASTLLSGYAGVPACIVSLELAAAQLEDGDVQRADRTLKAAPPGCPDTARGMLLQVDIAEQLQWDALQDAWLDEAFARFPAACSVARRWNERQEEQGLRPGPDRFPVWCDDLPASQGDLPDPSRPEGAPPHSPGHRPGLVPGNWDTLSREEKLALVRDLPGDYEATDWRDWLDGASFTDPQLPWMLVDLHAARAESDKVSVLAEAVRGHRGAWGPLRAQAGKLGAWQKALPWLSDPEAVVREYVAAGFAKDMPQVLVLDEALALPDANGWMTLFETSLLHVVSADAAEDIGEVALAAGEELYALAVRKGNGVWLAPQYDAAGHVKDTLSLPGLSPGDFVLRSTIREIPLPGAASGCVALPSFYFAGREHPVYLSRYVVLDPGSADLEVSVAGGVATVQRDEKAWVFEKRGVSPTAAEPFCPDPESGLPVVHVVSRCLDWPAVRDRLADQVTALCDTALPAELTGIRDARTMFRRVLDRVQPSGEGLTASPLSEILRTGRGNVSLALYCHLVQAGFPAQLVAVNSLAGRPLDLHRPGLAAFDTAVVKVPDGEQDVWLDPYDRMAEAGYLRPALRGRTGMVLAVRHPRLFLRTPERAWDDTWSVAVTSEAASSGRVSGELSFSCRGLAAAELDAVLRDQTGERLEQTVQALAGQFVARSVVSSHEYTASPGRARLRVSWSAQLPGAAGGVLLFFLPPTPPSDLVRLAGRTSPLYFQGVLPVNVRVEMSAGKGVSLAHKPLDGRVSASFGELSAAAGGDAGAVVVRRSGSAPPAVVLPDAYPAFARFVGDMQNAWAVPIEVRINGQDR